MSRSATTPAWCTHRARSSIPWEIAAAVLILGNAYVLRSRYWPNKRGCDSSSLRLCDGVVCGRAKHGWNGRLSNLDLEPEMAHNGEIIAMAQTGRLFHDASLYSSHDDDVIKEEAENAGSRALWADVSPRQNSTRSNSTGTATPLVLPLESQPSMTSDSGRGSDTTRPSS